jgi:ABC-type glutathione transport system ATPase component
LDENFNYTDILSYYNLKEFGGCHSGDIVDAPNGASEFIDVNLEKLRQNGVRYIVMTINSYTHQPFCDLPECFAGWMSRQNANSGEIFEPKTVADRMKSLLDVGLGYIKLGQSSDTLSGGESQRVKVSSELYRPMTQKTIYLLDEPTVGLHFEDVKRLIEVLNKLVERGNTVVLIEHNLDVIKCADYLLDFGPEGGTGGGQLIAKGTPEEVANNAASYTGKYLKKMLKKK